MAARDGRARYCRIYTQSMKTHNPLVLHHLLLLQRTGGGWFCRSASTDDRNTWQAQSETAPCEVFTPLSAAVDLLQRAPRGGMRDDDTLTVLLAYPYVRHAVLPWDSGLTTAADWQAHANAIFDAQYGGYDCDALSQQIVIDPAPDGHARLAMAVDAAMMQGLHTLARAHNLRLVSCRSLLMAAVHRHRDHLVDDCVLSLPQQDAFECLYRKQGLWQTVRRVPAVQDAALGQVALQKENVAPLLAMMPFTGNPRQRQENAPATRWLGAAHPWLEERGNRRHSEGGTDTVADHGADRRMRAPPYSTPDLPIGASIAPPVMGVVTRDAGGWSREYWCAADWMAQSGRYGAWRDQAYRHSKNYASYAMIYCWFGVPLSWWKEGRHFASYGGIQEKTSNAVNRQSTPDSRHAPTVAAHPGR